MCHSFVMWGQQGVPGVEKMVVCVFKQTRVSSPFKYSTEWFQRPTWLGYMPDFKKKIQTACDTLVFPCVSVGIGRVWFPCEGIYLVKRAIFGSRWLRWEHTASPTWAEREVVNRGPTGVRSKCLSSDTRITSRKKCQVAFLVSSTSCVIRFGFGIDLFWTQASNNTPMLTVSCCIV